MLLVLQGWADTAHVASTASQIDAEDGKEATEKVRSRVGLRRLNHPHVFCDAPGSYPAEPGTRRKDLLSRLYLDSNKWSPCGRQAFCSHPEQDS